MRHSRSSGSTRVDRSSWPSHRVRSVSNASHCAYTNSSAPPTGMCIVMDPELRAHANMPVVLTNREGLYVIIAVLGIAILSCTCVLTYSFTNYSRLKRNAEEVRNYIAA
ncbi:hypothetical protein HPB49_002651 [Dermacentor silvarum]|uniref:Uncharacterized protein n=1 Tax=Dermacentor silvarum TaxID=543639 RepID=A0ACB8C728_DERSI|nr:hypothetical protein HPB49_002651 [Dermacentor silvarum]